MAFPPNDRTAATPASARPARRSAAALAAALPLAVFPLLAVACASPPELKRVIELTPTSAVTVVYEQPRQAFRQTLQSDDRITPADFYSARDADPLAKLLSTERMQVLLDALGQKGLFDDARPEPLPGAVATLDVIVDGRSYVWSKSAGMPPQEMRRYHEALTIFLNIYNATESFHVSRGRDAVLEEHERMIRERERQQLERLRARSGTQGGGQRP